MVAFRGSGPGHSVEPTSKTRSVACLLFCLRAQFGRTNPNQDSRANSEILHYLPASSRLLLEDGQVGADTMLHLFRLRVRSSDFVRARRRNRWSIVSAPT